ncbi:MAG TPA: thioesterase family protein [Gemmataceae bacterium]|nr:thioesterase family protein [Gemmataceae bacterium]
MADVAEVLAKYPVIVRQAVVWGDMDSYRHVNNVVYFRYFENVRLEYVRLMGWFEYEEKTGIGPILASTQARFRRPLTYPDTIAIAARAIDLGEDRFTFDHVIVSEAQQAVVTEGSGLVVVYNYKDGKKAALTSELRGMIEKLERRK